MIDEVVIIPCAPGRESNLELVLERLDALEGGMPQVLVVVDGGADQIMIERAGRGGRVDEVLMPKHEPGAEQPRNVGVRMARHLWPSVTHAWFLDSDILVEPDCLEQLVAAIRLGPERIIVAPYDWGAEGVEWAPRGDPDLVPMEARWPMFDASPPERVYTGDLSAGLACWGGNLVWPIDEFIRVGGFWNELYAGRCEDGELGLRAVAMGVPISFCAAARGFHRWHPSDYNQKAARNARDVPMIDARHPWLHDSNVLLTTDRDGAAFDALCSHCQQRIPTGQWWEHASSCGHVALPIR